MLGEIFGKLLAKTWGFRGSCDFMIFVTLMFTVVYLIFVVECKTFKKITTDEKEEMQKEID